MKKTWNDRLISKNISIDECVEKKIWIDGQDKLHYIEGMSKLYIENCMKFLYDERYIAGHHIIELPKILKKNKKIYLKMFRTELENREKNKIKNGDVPIPGIDY